MCCVFMAALGLHCCLRAPLVRAGGGSSLAAVLGLLAVEASLDVEPWPRALRAVVVLNGRVCPAACGIFLDQGLNPCPLYWQADS